MTLFGCVTIQNLLNIEACMKITRLYRALFLSSITETYTFFAVHFIEYEDDELLMPRREV